MKSKNLLKIFSTVILMAPITIGLSSCEGSGVRFANYESYTSTDLMDRLREKYDIQYLTYESNETLEIKFSRSYDIAVPSTYEVINLLRLDKLEKIEWDRFNLENNKKPITSAIEAESLLTDDVKNLLHGLNKQYENDEKIKEILKEKGIEKFHILDWGIPYFLQSFIFGYKGEAINSLDKENCTMEEVLTVVEKDKRFDEKISRRGKVGITDDFRTVYSASRLIKNDSVNPTDEKTEGTVENIKSVYKNFTKNIRRGQCNLNSDSGMLVSTFVDPKGMNGLFAYNGDMLYAATGAEIVDAFTSENFHVPKLDKTFLALDMIVINTGQSEKKKNDIYGVIKDGFLEGLDDSETSSQKDQGEEFKHIQDCDKDGNYIYGPMLNFDFVMYTSPFWKINEYITDPNGDYFDDQTRDLMVSIYEIKAAEEDIKYLENPLSNLTKSNMGIAWRAMKENI